MKKLSTQNRELGPACKRVFEYAFQNPHLSRKELAAALSLSPQRIGQILGHRKVQALYPVAAKNRMRTVVVAKATKAYEEIIDQDDNLAAREKASKAVLDSNKVLEPEQVNVRHTIELMPMKDLVQRVRDLKNIPEPFVDAELIDPSNEVA